jgi:hypothetical protein
MLSLLAPLETLISSQRKSVGSTLYDRGWTRSHEVVSNDEEGALCCRPYGASPTRSFTSVAQDRQRDWGSRRGAGVCGREGRDVRRGCVVILVRAVDRQREAGRIDGPLCKIHDHMVRDPHYV